MTACASCDPRAAPTWPIPIADIVSGKPVPPRPSVRDRVLAGDGPAPRVRPLPRPGDLRDRRLGAARLRHRDRAARPLGAGLRTLRRRRRRRAGRGPLRAADRRGRYAGRPSTSDCWPWAGCRRATRPTRSSRSPGSRRSPGRCAATARPTPCSTRRAGRLGPGADRRPGDRATPASPRLGRASAASRWPRPARRRGLGLAVMAELLDWGAERGATTAYLQVLATTRPALALYETARLPHAPPLPLPHAQPELRARPAARG